MNKPVLSLAALFVLGTCAPRVPAYVESMERAPQVVTLPKDDPAHWRMAHLDVETTGLVPGYHEMIDAGLVITDLEGNVVDSLFLRIQPKHPERSSPGALRVNGFDAAKWKAMHALTYEEAADSFIAFNKRVNAGYNVLLTIFNSQFDTAFLDHLLRPTGHSWRELYFYFVLDIPSMAWSLGCRDLTNGGLAKRLGVADEPRVATEHTGITGAMLNVRIYRALRHAPACTSD